MKKPASELFRILVFLALTVCIPVAAAVGIHCAALTDQQFSIPETTSDLPKAKDEQ